MAFSDFKWTEWMILGTVALLAVGFVVYLLVEENKKKSSFGAHLAGCQCPRCVVHKPSCMCSVCKRGCSACSCPTGCVCECGCKDSELISMACDPEKEYCYRAADLYNKDGTFLERRCRACGQQTVYDVAHPAMASNFPTIKSGTLPMTHPLGMGKVPKDFYYPDIESHRNGVVCRTCPNV